MSSFRDWMYEKRRGPDGMITREFIDGVSMFLNFGFSNVVGNKILCPCKKCKNWREHDRNTIMQHLYQYGFGPDYRVWVCHGEDYYNCGINDNYNIEGSSSTSVENQFTSQRHMVMDNFPQFRDYLNNTPEDPNHEAKLFYYLLEYADRPVYELHNKSLLQWVTEIMNFKTTYNTSQKAMDYYIKSNKSMAPEQYQQQIPDSYSEVKNIMSKLGLGVIKYDVCINNCFL
ncbi:hypothetical protein OROGR_005486 [Orobanche gracilis]